MDDDLEKTISSYHAYYKENKAKLNENRKLNYNIKQFSFLTTKAQSSLFCKYRKECLSIEKLVSSLSVEDLATFREILVNIGI